MARVWLAICTALAVGAFGIGAATGATARPDSGIRGVVLYGPTCPVQRPGQTCERPDQATLVFRRASSRTVVARISTGTDGRFTVHLRAGRYLVKASARLGRQRSQSLVVSVTAHHFTDLTIHFDSGIR